MWLFMAISSAFFAGITAILAKCGIRKTDSDLATALRTIVVLIFSWIAAAAAGSIGSIADTPARSLIFLLLSGLATGASWICYFKALSIGDVNKVVPIDKSSTVLTMLLAFLFFQEEISPFKLCGMALIAVGVFLMIEKEEPSAGPKDRRWLVYAAGSAVFASLTSILGKLGISGLDSNLGTAIRTGVVLAMAWLMVFVTGKGRRVKELAGKELLFICLSGLATGASWLCYYRALQEGPASVVVPIDKLSVLAMVAFSRVVLHERLSKKSAVGLAALTAGTLAMLL